MLIEQKIRAILFYLSLLIFLAGLPLILSFALGYKFDARNLRFTKTGLIVLKTQPQGASIYLDGILLGDKTPYTIVELIPAEYNIRLELDNYYPWAAEAAVEAGRVARLEKIILFPLRANIKHLNKDKVSAFWLDESKREIYYIGNEEGAIYKSDREGDNFEEVGRIPEEISFPVKCRVSPDKEKMLCFNVRKAAVIDLISQRKMSYEPAVILDFPGQKIADMFWHSDSFHLIAITNKSIGVLEATRQATAVNLVNLDKRNPVAFYDETEDILYFMDSQKAEDGRHYDNVYKLELGTKFFPFQELMKPKTE